MGLGSTALDLFSPAMFRPLLTIYNSLKLSVINYIF